MREPDDSLTGFQQRFARRFMEMGEAMLQGRWPVAMPPITDTQRAAYRRTLWQPEERVVDDKLALEAEVAVLNLALHQMEASRDAWYRRFKLLLGYEDAQHPIDVWPIVRRDGWLAGKVHRQSVWLRKLLTQNRQLKADLWAARPGNEQVLVWHGERRRWTLTAVNEAAGALTNWLELHDQCPVCHIVRTGGHTDDCLANDFYQVQAEILMVRAVDPADRPIPS